MQKLELDKMIAIKSIVIKFLIWLNFKNFIFWSN